METEQAPRKPLTAEELLMALDPRNHGGDILYTRKQAALSLRLSVSTVDRLIKEGRLKPIYVTPRRPRFTIQELNRFVRDSKHPAGERATR